MGLLKPENLLVTAKSTLWIVQRLVQKKRPILHKLRFLRFKMSSPLRWSSSCWAVPNSAKLSCFRTQSPNEVESVTNVRLRIFKHISQIEEKAPVMQLLQVFPESRAKIYINMFVEKCLIAFFYGEVRQQGTTDPGKFSGRLNGPRDRSSQGAMNIVIFQTKRPRFPVNPKAKVTTTRSTLDGMFSKLFLTQKSPSLLALSFLISKQPVLNC